MKVIAVFAILAVVLSSHAAAPYIPLDGSGSDSLLNAVQVRAKRALSGMSVVSLGYAYEFQAQAALDHGDCLLWLEVEIENSRVSDELQVLPSEFRLITFDNVSHSYQASQREINSNIQRGEIAKGGLLFAIPTNSTPSSLRFQPGIVLRSSDYGNVDISATIPVQLRWNGTDFIKDEAYWREKWNEMNPRWKVRPKAPAAAPSVPEGKGRAAEALKMQNVQASRLAGQFQQASNGIPAAEFSLGLRYLNGDGVETNRPLALYWIYKAYYQGFPEATNFLHTRLQPQ